MINDLRWRDLADRGRNRHLTLFYNIVNHEVKVASECILILANGGTREGQAHNTFMHIVSKVDDYESSFYLRNITEWNKFPSSTINLPHLPF